MDERDFGSYDFDGSDRQLFQRAQSCEHKIHEPSIVLVAPRPGDKIADPVHIVGRGTAFEGMTHLRIRDHAGRVIAKGTALGGAAGIPKDFAATLRFSAQPAGRTGFVEAYELSVKDGAEIRQVRVPVIFRDATSEAGCRTIRVGRSPRERR
uniref:Bacterial spore germination immunoglobulin-like domain-containing protein n=1 Tax=Thermorudis peleae TaxID=1382356 RepID=A0A831X9M1_9BACT